MGNPDQPPPSTNTTDDVPPDVLKKAVAASAIGNATEWFDYGIYAYGVTYISAAIFPGDTQQATLLALMTFAVSFLVRPLGGLVWGPLGDRLGRRQVLAITILMMAGATLCVGLVPSYAAIGFWAPVLMVLLRMIQGFSTGGEYGGAATFMAEYAPRRSRGFFGSFLEFGTLAGFSCGALLMLGFSLVLNDDAMSTWGWRLPFLVAAPLGLVGVYLRSRLEDTPIFRELAEAGRDGGAHRHPVQGSDRAVLGADPAAWRPGRRAERRQLHAAELYADLPRAVDRPVLQHVVAGADHRHARDDGLPAVRGRHVGSGRAQTDVVVLAGRALRRRRADVHADGHQRRSARSSDSPSSACCMYPSWRRSRRPSRRCSQPRCATPDSPSPITCRRRSSAAPHRR